MKRLSQFYSRNRWTYKTDFFHFSIFSSKTNQKNELKFLQIIAIYILRYHDFSPKNCVFRKYSILILFRMLSIQFKYPTLQLKKKQKTILRIPKNRNKAGELSNPDAQLSIDMSKTMGIKNLKEIRGIQNKLKNIFGKF